MSTCLKFNFKFTIVWDSVTSYENATIQNLYNRKNSVILGELLSRLSLVWLSWCVLCALCGLDKHCLGIYTTEGMKIIIIMSLVCFSEVFSLSIVPADRSRNWRSAPRWQVGLGRRRQSCTWNMRLECNSGTPGQVFSHARLAPLCSTWIEMRPILPGRGKANRNKTGAAWRGVGGGKQCYLSYASFGLSYHYVIIIFYPR